MIMKSTKSITEDGYERWCLPNGKWHREDGPAIIYSNGEQRWYINGTNITPEVINWMKKQNVTWPWDDDIQLQFLLTFG